MTIESSVYRQIDPNSYGYTPVALIVLTGEDAIRHHAGRVENTVDITDEDETFGGLLLEQLRTAKAGLPTLEVARVHGLWELAERITDNEERHARDRWMESVLVDRFGDLPDDKQGTAKAGMMAILDALTTDTSVRADRLRDRMLRRHDNVLAGVS